MLEKKLLAVLYNENIIKVFQNSGKTNILDGGKQGSIRR